MAEFLKGKNSCIGCSEVVVEKKLHEELLLEQHDYSNDNCKNTDECKDEGKYTNVVCKNLLTDKVCRTNINSNVQYIADFFNSITINPWGIIMLDECNFCDRHYWVASNGNRTLNKYHNDGEFVESVSVTGGSPTGLIYNYTNYYNNFKLLTCTLQGTVDGVNIDNNDTPDLDTTVVISSEGAVYTGLDINRKRLYVCNFASAKVEMYDTNFSFIDSFTDDALVKSGYVPYNVMVKKKYVYVAFVKRDDCSNCSNSGIGFGYIDKFGRDGQLLFRFISREPLNAPWGMAISKCEKYLYVGNYGDGKINIFDLCTGEFIGPLKDKNCNDVQIGNLWGINLVFDRLSFASGMDNESSCDVENGLIGYLQFI
jgi:uncharacterized protein (TIGR03118 family)